MKIAPHSLPRPRILFLDIGDTILGWSSAAKNSAAGVIGAALRRPFGPRDLDHATMQLWANRHGSTLQGVESPAQEWAYWKRFYTALLVQVGIPHPPETLVEQLASFPVTPGTFTLFDDALPALESARRQGIRLGVISNAFVSVLGILSALRLENQFHPQILSYQVGLAKPQPEIYTLALEQAGVAPFEACFVDDRPVFIQAARSEGMQGILLDRKNEYAAMHLPTIQGLAELNTLWMDPGNTGLVEPGNKEGEYAQQR